MITLHAGLHKTGSSAIQTALDQRNVITNRDFLYWTRRRSDRTDDPLSNSVADGILRRSETTHVIMSDEGFFGSIGDMYGFLPERARRLRRLYGSAVRVVIYFRPHLEWARSAFIQEIKSGSREDPADFARRLLASRYFRWSLLAADLADILGPERLVLRPYGIGIDADHDFFRACALGPVPKSRRGNRVNVTLRPPQAALLHSINDRIDDWERARARFVMEHLSPPVAAEAPTSLFPESWERSINDHFRSDWASLSTLIDQTHSPDVEGFLKVQQSWSWQPARRVECSTLDPLVAAEAQRLTHRLAALPSGDPWAPSIWLQMQDKWRHDRTDIPRAAAHHLIRRRRLAR